MASGANILYLAPIPDNTFITNFYFIIMSDTSGALCISTFRTVFTKYFKTCHEHLLSSITPLNIYFSIIATGMNTIYNSNNILKQLSMSIESTVLIKLRRKGVISLFSETKYTQINNTKPCFYLR